MELETNRQLPRKICPGTPPGTLMITQREQLIEKLSRFGWRVAEINEEPSPWWADEEWIIESEWSPLGFQLFLTFLVDLESDTNRKKGEQVSAIGAALKKPNDRNQASEQSLIFIKPKWEKRLPLQLP